MESFQNFQRMVNSKLDGPMRSHLKNVYASIASSTAVAGVGAYAHYNGYFGGGILSGLGSIVLIVLLSLNRDTENKEGAKRFMYLNGLALCTGLSTGPLIEMVWDLNPTIVISALLYTFVIFTCFTVSAIVAPDGKYLALGGPLLSVLSTMLIASILNMFVRSHTILYIQLVIGLVVMSAFILYDTQMIMEKFRMGDKDYVWHSLTLFLDLVSIFKHILILLTDKEHSSNDRRKKSNR